MTNTNTKREPYVESHTEEGVLYFMVDLGRRADGYDATIVDNLSGVTLRIEGKGEFTGTTYNEALGAAYKACDSGSGVIADVLYVLWKAFDFGGEHAETIAYVHNKRKCPAYRAWMTSPPSEWRADARAYTELREALRQRLTTGLDKKRSTTLY